jgi:hypothetical protein
MRAYRVDEPEPEPDFDDDFDDGMVDVGLPHGGLWSRPKDEDGLRCREHDLRPDQH